MHYALLSLQEPQPKFLHGNTKFVEYPRAGEARIGCELSPARMGPAAGTHEGLSLKSGRNLLPFGRGGLSFVYQLERGPKSLSIWFAPTGVCGYAMTTFFVELAPALRSPRPEQPGQREPSRKTGSTGASD
jgi:hypothetical protein